MAEIGGLARAARRAEGWAARLSRLALELGTAAGFACFFLVCYSVLMRYLVGRPQSWVDEVVGWLVAAAVMLALPDAQRRGENIGVDVVSEKARGAWARLLGILGTGAVIASAIVMLNAGIEMVAFSRMVGLISNVASMPEWIVQLVVPIGAALLLVVALVEFALRALALEPEGPREEGAGNDPTKGSVE
jgi:C4-dicarboxylate transporter DctQ subunit